MPRRLPGDGQESNQAQMINHVGALHGSTHIQFKGCIRSPRGCIRSPKGCTVPTEESLRDSKTLRRPAFGGRAARSLTLLSLRNDSKVGARTRSQGSRWLHLRLFLTSLVDDCPSSAPTCCGIQEVRACRLRRSESKHSLKALHACRLRRKRSTSNLVRLRCPKAAGTCHEPSTSSPELRTASHLRHLLFGATRTTAGSPQRRKEDPKSMLAPYPIKVRGKADRDTRHLLTETSKENEMATDDVRTFPRGRGAPPNHKPRKRPFSNVNHLSPPQNSGGVVTYPPERWRVCRECSVGFRWVADGPGRPPSFCSSTCRFRNRRRYRARWMRGKRHADIPPTAARERNSEGESRVPNGSEIEQG